MRGRCREGGGGGGRGRGRVKGGAGSGMFIAVDGELRGWTVQC